MLQSLEVGTQQHSVTATRQRPHVQHHARPNTLAHGAVGLGGTPVVALWWLTSDTCCLSSWNTWPELVDAISSKAR